MDEKSRQEALALIETGRELELSDEEILWQLADVLGAVLLVDLLEHILREAKWE